MKPKSFYIIILCVLLLPGMSALFGCRTKVEVTSRVDPGDDLFLEADRMFQVKMYDKALEGFKAYLTKYPNGQLAPAALMREGTIYSAGKQFETARNVYQHLIRTFPRSPFVRDAQVEILASLYRQGQYEAVLARGRTYLEMSDSDTHGLKILWILGDTAMAAGMRKQAVSYYVRGLNLLRHPMERERFAPKIVEAVKQLSTGDIRELMEQIDDPLAKGYLYYQLGINQLDEENNEEAVEILSEFIQNFADHPYAGQARKLVERMDAMPVYRRHTVGCLLPLTGRYRVYGNRAWRGIELALALANRPGRPSINVIVKDTGSDPQRAVEAVAQLFNEQVSAIIGPIITAEEASREAQSRGIPIVTLTQKMGVTKIGDNVFRNFLTPDLQVRAVVSHARQSLGIDRFAVLYPDEKYGTTFMNLFWDEVIKYGGRVVGVESYAPNQTDFAGPIKKLIGPHRKRGEKPQLDFDALFIPDSPKMVGLIIPQLAFHDVENVQLLGTNLWNNDHLIRLAGKFAQGAVVPDGFFKNSISEPSIAFIQAFQQAYGEEPKFIEAVAYDTAQILFKLLTRSGMRTRSALKKSLMNLVDFPGVTGLTSFDETGEADKKLYLLQLQGNEFIEIRDPGAPGIMDPETQLRRPMPVDGRPMSPGTVTW